jgi:casein kinase II subunit beta
MSSPWVDSFCSEPRRRYFVKIELSYLNDNFNFFGLRGFSHESQLTFLSAVDAIRGPSLSSERRPQELTPDVERAAVRLYGLLHARYLLTQNALCQMYDKFTRKEFPRCPRICCGGQVCLPYGPNDEIEVSMLRMFCPECREVYVADDEISHSIDGAYFGPSWIHLFVQRYERKLRVVPHGELKKPNLRLFGFEIECRDDSSEEN